MGNESRANHGHVQVKRQRVGITREAWTGHAFEGGDAGPVLAGLVVDHDLSVPLNTRKACRPMRERAMASVTWKCLLVTLQGPYLHQVWWHPKGSSCWGNCVVKTDSKRAMYVLVSCNAVKRCVGERKEEMCARVCVCVCVCVCIVFCGS